MLARQSRQECNASSYPRRILLAQKRANGIHVENIEGGMFNSCPAEARQPGAPPGSDRARIRFC
ncbi:hypothetical protein GCM10017624_32910 [Azotobacter vinelandii]|nr:hypothetical protein GCM10017624_32910 [Azotobacter vinelandii]